MVCVKLGRSSWLFSDRQGSSGESELTGSHSAMDLSRFSVWMELRSIHFDSTVSEGKNAISVNIETHWEIRLGLKSGSLLPQLFNTGILSV